jgi:hypothetical protein
MKHVRLILMVLVSAGVVCIAQDDDPLPAPTISDGIQIGSTGRDIPWAGVRDADGNIYLAGEVGGALLGQLPHMGGKDIWLGKFTPNGTSAYWIITLGTPMDDAAWEMELAPDGSIYVGGRTGGPLAGNAQACCAVHEGEMTEAWIIRFDTNGNDLWKDQFGEGIYMKFDDLGLDAEGNLYVACHSFHDIETQWQIDYDVPILVKYDDQGNHLWTKQFKDVDRAYVKSVMAVAEDGTCYVVSETYDQSEGSELTNEDFEARDIRIQCFDSDGALQWTSDYLSDGRDWPGKVELDETNGELIVSGSTWGDLCGDNAGGRDGFYFRTDLEGNWLSGAQLGTDMEDFFNAMTLDDDGTLYLFGRSERPIAEVLGSGRLLMTAYDPDDQPIWRLQFGTPEMGQDVTGMIPLPYEGELVVAGHTEGDLVGTNAGEQDLIIVRFTLPEIDTTNVQVLPAPITGSDSTPEQPTQADPSIDTPDDTDPPDPIEDAETETPDPQE